MRTKRPKAEERYEEEKEIGCCGSKGSCCGPRRGPRDEEEEEGDFDDEDYDDYEDDEDFDDEDFDDYEDDEDFEEEDDED